MTRPSIRSAEIEKAILDGLSDGVPLAELCRRDAMPHADTWRNWCDADEALREAYHHSRDFGFDAIAADVLTIIDNIDEEAGSRRVRAEYRLKLLAKWDPKRYGDKLDLTTKGDKITPRAALKLSTDPIEAARQYEQLMRGD